MTPPDNIQFPVQSVKRQMYAQRANRKSEIADRSTYTSDFSFRNTEIEFKSISRTVFCFFLFLFSPTRLREIFISFRFCLEKFQCMMITRKCPLSLSLIF